MKFLGAVILVVAVATANAGLLAGGLLGAPVDSAAVITGPSGQIVRSGLAVASAPVLAHSAPLISAHAGPIVAAHAPLALAVPNARIAPAGVIVPAGHGLEGQWIPDITDKLYDDGSYKPQIYGL